jgi:hypothetical protein
MLRLTRRTRTPGHGLPQDNPADIPRRRKLNERNPIKELIKVVFFFFRDVGPGDFMREPAAGRIALEENVRT